MLQLLKLDESHFNNRGDIAPVGVTVPEGCQYTSLHRRQCYKRGVSMHVTTTAGASHCTSLLRQGCLTVSHCSGTPVKLLGRKDAVCKFPVDHMKGLFLQFTAVFRLFMRISCLFVHFQSWFLLFQGLFCSFTAVSELTKVFSAISGLNSGISRHSGELSTNFGVYSAISGVISALYGLQSAVSATPGPFSATFQQFLAKSAVFLQNSGLVGKNSTYLWKCCDINSFSKNFWDIAGFWDCFDAFWGSFDGIWGCSWMFLHFGDNYGLILMKKGFCTYPCHVVNQRSTFVY